MIELGGCADRLLRIDFTNKRAAIFQLPESLITSYNGRTGFCAKNLGLRNDYVVIRENENRGLGRGVNLCLDGLGRYSE